MNEIKVKIVADSVSVDTGKRITSIECTYPRIIHAEVMTHRMFSRNAASSRAIPNAKLIQSIIDNPFVPMAWQKKHKGMQGNEYFVDELVKDIPNNSLNYETDTTVIQQLNLEWLRAKDLAIEQAQKITALGATKQLANRILEPYQYYKVLITATEWENFFALRCPKYVMWNSYGKHVFNSKKDFLWNVGLPDEASNYNNYTTVDWLKLNEGTSEIHIMALAEKIWDALKASIPRKLNAGEWHVPYQEQIEDSKVAEIAYPLKQSPFTYDEEFELTRLKIATAQCARISYTTINEQGVINYDKDVELHDSLLKSGHFSPFEHCAKSTIADFTCGNFTGWLQYRKLIE